jgi:hypothetical protein
MGYHYIGTVFFNAPGQLRPLPMRLWADDSAPAYVGEADWAAAQTALDDVFAANPVAAQIIAFKYETGLDLFITPPDNRVSVVPGVQFVAQDVDLPFLFRGVPAKLFGGTSLNADDGAAWPFMPTLAVRQDAIKQQGMGILLHEISHKLVVESHLDLSQYPAKGVAEGEVMTTVELVAYDVESWFGYGRYPPDSDSGPYGRGTAADIKLRRDWLEGHRGKQAAQFLRAHFGTAGGSPARSPSGATPTPRPNVPFLIPADDVSTESAGSAKSGSLGPTAAPSNRAGSPRGDPSEVLPDWPLPYLEEPFPEPGPPPGGGSVPTANSSAQAPGPAAATGAGGNPAGQGPDASTIGTTPFGQTSNSQPASAALPQETGPGLNATSPTISADGGTAVPTIDAPSIDVGALSSAVDELLQALSDFGLSDLSDLGDDLSWILGGGIDFLPPPPSSPNPPNDPQSGPDPEDNPPPPDDGGPDVSTAYAASVDTGGMTGGDPPDDPGAPGTDWGPTPKGDPPEGQPGGGGTAPPQWPGYPPSPGDPMQGLVTGNADPSGIGQMWDEALGAAAALAQALPSAQSKIAAALQAYFAAHPGSAPPDWLAGVSLLGSLPPGMTLGEYLLEHDQYQVQPGQTYARVGGPSPWTGPGDPTDPYAGGGPGGGGDDGGDGDGGGGGDSGGGSGGGSGTGGGGGIIDDPGTGPWDPTSNLGAGGGGRRPPGPGDGPMVE